jgi:hypothetical protein
MGANGENHKAQADALRHQALVDALDGIEAGDLSVRNAVRRLRLQYSRAWREYERPYFDMKANTYSKAKRRDQT